MVAAFGLAQSVARAAAAEAAVPPRLAVVISIDQGRADYLDRFAPYFCEGGFRRLKDQGANFAECYYEHSTTITAVGHATILTGVHPSVHGIVGNAWLDRADWKTVTAVDDATSPVVGGPPQPGRSPRLLLSATVGDQLKQRYGSAARVFSVSNKDRAAILMGGKLADAAFWLGVNDRFVSSHYYRPNDQLPGWVDAFNQAHPSAAYFGKTWERIAEPAAYDLVQGADDAPGEFEGYGLGRVFPHQIDGGKAAPGIEFSEAFDRSPFALELLAAFARETVEQEQLGADTVPDLLCIGFSQIDIVGHEYGPDSHELMDSFLRLDRILADLLTFFDTKVGAGQYVVVITADHGVAPLPERTRATGLDPDAARIDLREVDRAVTSALVAAFGADPQGQPWCKRDNSGYHLRAGTLEALHVSVAQASAVVKAALLAQPGIAAAFTATELMEAPDLGTAPATLFRHSQHAERSPEVRFALAPYAIERLGTGTTHGSHHDYDTHVPMLWFGPGVPRGQFVERVGVTDLAPTLAGLLGVTRPVEARGRQLF